MDSEENREYWEYVEKTSKEVEETYPNWKKGGEKFDSRNLSDESRILGSVNDSSGGTGYNFS